MGGFYDEIPHINAVSKLCLSAFKSKYQSWCKTNHYKYSEAKAEQIHAYSRKQVSSLPMTDAVIKIVAESAKLLNSTLETLTAIRTEMDKLSSTLPEYKTVMGLCGVGRVLGSQLIAEIGDVRRFDRSKSIVAMAGIDPPPNQSGQIDVKSRSISKRGSPLLRKTLFQIMQVILQKQPINEPVYQFLDRKRAEGKPYRVYMVAATNKFLKIYYARVIVALA